MSARYLGVEMGRSGFYSVLVESDGSLLARGKGRSFEAALPKELPQPLEVCVASAGGVPVGTQALLSRSESVWVCRPEEAQLAGYLAGQTGLVLVSGLEAVVVGVDRSYQPRILRQTEGSAVWLGREALLQHTASPRLQQEVQRRLERLPDLDRNCLGGGFKGGLDPNWGTRQEQRRQQREVPWAPSPDDLRLLCQAAQVVLELAEFPGPEPFSRALVLKAARRLTELCRRLAAGQFACRRISYSGLGLKGALLEAVQEECARYLPQLSWHPPRFSAEVGAALLAAAGQRERLSRRDEKAELRPVSQDVWRVLQRERRPFPNYPA